MMRLVLLWITLITLTAIHLPGQIPPGSVQQHRRTFIDSLQALQMPKAGAEERIIVEFREPPLLRTRRLPPGPAVQLAPASYRSRFPEIAADLQSLLAAYSSSPSDRVSIRHEYLKCFFGAGMTVPSWMTPMIQRLPYVRSIHPDRQVHLSTDPSIVFIGVPAVWEQYGTRGEGIRIGIIDSGIDYLHPDLGGGLGAGFKVAGGYDFVNGDTDPMDDNGHGTHVAGIVSANGDSVKGVAPMSTLYAYKVLGANGYGSESDIIAAIERTVDPDQDGNEGDHLDVVNVSLGSMEGSPTDPTSVAVDNAVELGVVFCIAAGNSGGRTPVQGKETNYFFDGSATIGSPGTSERAITVGASDLSDTLARFSSRGPNRVSFSIKPDLLAPGVGISSTWLASGYATLNGTSMATPMVTGIAALLKSIHPSWTPAYIKSALVNRTKDLGLSAFLQGSGRVQAGSAAMTSTMFEPQSLSFGLDGPGLPLWSRPETLMVHNLHATSQSYSTTVTGAGAGVSLTVLPAAFSIPPDDSIPVVVSVSVNNATIPIEEENILRFTGSVVVHGTVDTAHIPWAFVRASRLVITTSEPGAFFLGYSNSSAILGWAGNVVWTAPTRAEVYAPTKGTYEFFTLFRNPAGISRIVIDEQMQVGTNDAAIFLDATKAVHPLIYHGVDHLGNPLHSYRAPQRSLIMSLPNFGNWTTTLQGGSDTLLLSPMSAGHALTPVEFQFDLAASKTFHIVRHGRSLGMNGPRSIANVPSEFLRQQFVLKVPPGTSAVAQSMVLYNYSDATGSGLLGGIGFDVDTVAIDDDACTFTGYFGRSSDPTEEVALTFSTNYIDLLHPTTDYEGPMIMRYGDSLIAVTRDRLSPAAPRFADGDTMTFGGSPPHLLMLWYNNTFGEHTLHFRTLFRGMLRENRFNDQIGGTYTLYDGDGAELFTRSLNEVREPLSLAPARYTMRVTSSNYWLRHRRGRITLASEFDLGAGLPANPPSITCFMVLDGSGKPTELLDMNEAGTLTFSVNVINFSDNELPVFDSTRAWYRKHGDTDWVPLTLTKVSELVDNEGLVLRASLAGATMEDSAAIDLRVAAKGANGFSVDQVVSPAFAVGAWDTTVTGVDPPDGRIPRRFVLEQNYPNPFNPTTSIKFQIPNTNLEIENWNLSFVSLKVFDILGREVATLVEGPMVAGEHEVRWEAGHCAGGVYYYRMSAGEWTETKKMVLIR